MNDEQKKGKATCTIRIEVDGLVSEVMNECRGTSNDAIAISVALSVIKTNSNRNAHARIAALLVQEILEGHEDVLSELEHKMWDAAAAIIDISEKETP